MRPIKTLLTTCLLLLCLNFNLKAQEQLGLRTDSYSGINSIMLNPANFISSQFKWDVNLVGVGLFLENSYGFIHNTNLLDIARLFPNVDGALTL